MAAILAPGDPVIGFAALTHDLGKALTPKDVLPKHIGHEHAGLAPLAKLCERLKVPAAQRELAIIACREHLNVHRIDEMRDDTVHDFIARCDGFRQPERIDQLALVCEADKRGRLGMQDVAYPQAATLRALHRAALAVNARDLVAQGITGTEVGVRLRAARIAAIHAARSPRKDP
jgi:tRNA nucleotidyltransferase (CCA-adding enzyme)